MPKYDFFLLLKICLYVKYDLCIVKIKQVMSIFVCQGYEKSKFPNFGDLGPNFCIWPLVTNNILQHGMIDDSFIDILGALRPPPIGATESERPYEIVSIAS